MAPSNEPHHPYEHVAYGNPPPLSKIHQTLKPRSRRSWRDWVYIIGQLIIGLNPLADVFALRDLNQALQDADKSMRP